LQFISNSLGLYSKTYPSPENAVNIFENGWASALPDLDGRSLKAGRAALFDDERIRWSNEQSDGFKGKRILELGPLEGGHSYMLQQMGADSVLAIEANNRQFLKCLIVKQLYHLDKCEFALGDFVKYMESTSQVFDFCLASGVLYHMKEPVELLALIAKVSERAMIWTQYYDQALIRERMPYYKRSRFSPGEQGNYQGFAYTRYKRRYGLGLRHLNFWGGTDDHSYWLKLDDIIAALKHLGFKKIETNFHEPKHVNGPAICLMCSKS
jgi:hypothetical protein